MDLIFNCPIKRHLRSAQALYTSLKSWKLDLSLLKKGQPKPPFDPPMLTDVDGMKLVSEAMRKFTRDDFVLSVRKVFVDVGWRQNLTVTSWSSLATLNLRWRSRCTDAPNPLTKAPAP